MKYLIIIFFVILATCCGNPKKDNYPRNSSLHPENKAKTDSLIEAGKKIEKENL